MSRLTNLDVKDLAMGLHAHDEQLKRICGEGLRGIAQNGSGKCMDPMGTRVGVIPITTGLGVISGFAEAVSDILCHLGANAFVTAYPDVKGIRQALEERCDILFMADDDAFIAMNLLHRVHSDNGEATGRGFAAALDLAAGGVSGKHTLILGAGPVGLAAASLLHSRGGRVHLHDPDAIRMSAALQSLRFLVPEESLEEALAKCPLVLDATPAQGFLSHEQLRPGAIVSAPGVPLGIAQESLPLMEGALIHDVLEIGVATMLYDVL